MKKRLLFASTLFLSQSTTVFASNNFETPLSIECTVNQVNVLRTYLDKTDSFTHIEDDPNISYFKKGRKFALDVEIGTDTNKSVLLSARPINFSLGGHQGGSFFQYRANSSKTAVINLPYRQAINFGTLASMMAVGPDEITDYKKIELRKTGGLWYGSHTSIHNLRADKVSIVETAGFSCKTKKDTILALYNRYLSTAKANNYRIIQ